jgi:hypothetical protein
MMEKLEQQIPVLVCKLEKIFPPDLCGIPFPQVSMIYHSLIVGYSPP